jgi:hypothetical protein
LRNDENAAVAAAAALLQPGEEEAEETVVPQDPPEGEAAQETEEEEILFPSFDIELPEDLEEELTAPTLEEAEQEIENQPEYEDLDEDGRRLLARALHAEREAAFYRDQRVKSDKSKWVEEAKKFMPLSQPFLDDIKADSRRAFLREAKKYHEAVLPLVKPITDQAKATIEAEKEKARAEARAEAEKAWGQLPKDDGPPTEAMITQDQLDRNRSRGDLSSTIRAMIFPKEKS